MAELPRAACGLWEPLSRGRRFPEPRHPYRSEFQRDRDRVIHSRAFRRLENKTQVFSRRYSDHFRTRLTHSLEVAQISRTVAGAVGLNADLVETLALAHDLGHPPFGHAGEHALDLQMQPHGERFDHNLQALRIVEQFERRYASFPGLNLTYEVREGLIKHSHDYSAATHPELAEYQLQRQPPLEAQIIDLTDEIAYSAADLDDGFEAQLLRFEQIETVPLLARLLGQVDATLGAVPPKLRFYEMQRRLVDYLASDLIASLATILPALPSVEAVRDAGRRLAAFSPEVELERRTLKAFLYDNLYHHPQLQEENRRAQEIVAAVFSYYWEHPEGLPGRYRERAQTGHAARTICDYVAGMTDSFITRAI